MQQFIRRRILTRASSSTLIAGALLLTLGSAACGEAVDSGQGEAGDPSLQDAQAKPAPAQRASNSASEEQRPGPAREEYQERESGIIIGSEDWWAVDMEDPTDTGLPRIEHSARSVFDLGGCTGFLVADNYAATADHCWDSRSNSTQYSVQFAPGDYPPNFLDRRTKQLGLTAPIGGWDDAFDCRSYESFNTSQHGDRDILMLRCDSEAATDQWNYSVSVPPAAIWGHSRVTYDYFENSEDLAVLSVNETSWDTTDKVLWSSGMTTDKDNGWWNGHQGTFEHNADTLGGSSGGAVFSRWNQKVHGVNIGHTWNTNVGSYFPSRIKDYRGHTNGNRPDSLPYDSSWYYGAWLGGSGGNYYNLSCPPDFAAVGIIGRTSGWNDTGNFGIICGPYDDTLTFTKIRTEDYVVRVGGDYWTSMSIHEYYYNRYVQRFPDNEELHCKPGSYITHIYADEANNRIGNVSAIVCTAPGDTVGTWTRSVSAVPGAAMGTIDGTWGYSSCPSGDAVQGIRIRAGYVTDGFGVKCKEI
ncbi:hypothetical protein FIV42_28630 [Persicimonas caeni]|uniref:Peptidase S1 domain-containing protein n=1 Tax=Persicimonas caeni TaxID=2292766 RepID=A0A4Y6Q322_PERCE|nr:trypsin-like serine protease [Persicimonas caeni]QDG54567.1 hypothetical protein FIV42_28630 [Persicimonas caeni]QED35788.1 hypothetical protein FRD00_28625 [Persicimonas caeni]